MFYDIEAQLVIPWTFINFKWEKASLIDNDRDSILVMTLVR